MKENSVYSRFWDTLYKNRKKCENSVFWAFRATFRKKCEKTVFFHVFGDTVNEVCRKCEKKTAIVERFAQRSAKKWEKKVFFTWFETLCTKFAKYAKNSVFWAFCAMFRKNCKKKTVFSSFLRDTLYEVYKK